MCDGANVWSVGGKREEGDVPKKLVEDSPRNKSDS